MQRFSRLSLGMGILLCGAVSNARADWVELANHDLVQGEIVSLDGETLKLKSENFGEMTIPRSKVKLIGLGDRPLPTTAPTSAVGKGSPQLSSQLPSLENPEANQLLQQVLGRGGIGELSQTINKTKEDLKRLQQDMKSTPEGDALDSYIQMFELFGNLVPRGNPPKALPKPPQEKAEQQPPGEKP